MHRELILLVEDSVELNAINRRALEMRGYAVFTALTLSEAREYLMNHDPAVILLDVLLPDGSGFEFCAEIRESTNAHILFLTSRAEHQYRVKGLCAGGDDYITKPFHPEEMLARVAAAIRRRNMEVQKPHVRTITRGSLTLNVVANRAYLNGRDAALKPKEFALLLMLVRNEGREVSAKELYETVWNLPANGDMRTIWAHISKLRKKLSLSDEDPLAIKSVYGAGYRFIYHEE